MLRLKCVHVSTGLCKTARLQNKQKDEESYNPVARFKSPRHKQPGNGYCLETNQFSLTWPEIRRSVIKIKPAASETMPSRWP